MADGFWGKFFATVSEIGVGTARGAAAGAAGCSVIGEGRVGGLVGAAVGGTRTFIHANTKRLKEWAVGGDESARTPNEVIVGSGIDIFSDITTGAVVGAAVSKILPLQEVVKSLSEVSLKEGAMIGAAAMAAAAAVTGVQKYGEYIGMRRAEPRLHDDPEFGSDVELVAAGVPPSRTGLDRHART